MIMWDARVTLPHTLIFARLKFEDSGVLTSVYHGTLGTTGVQDTSSISPALLKSGAS
jgi:hypothetical protein